MTVVAMICQAILIASAVYGLYHVVIAWPIVGTLAAPAPRSQRTHRFAVLVFAKDEAAVIGQLLDSLRAQEYPDDAYEVFVTADNCTDDTADLARRAGATVSERSDRTRIGKGYALTWFFERFERAADFDACVIFDADNLVDPGFLAAMNRQLNAGHPVAVGYRAGKNPSSSWISGSNTLFWLMQWRLFHLPRARRGLPITSVGGTGFMFALDVLGGRGWQTSSACEDIEFTLRAILDGHQVALAPDALFYDEQPLTFGQSMRQRYRWAVGSMQVLGLLGPDLLRAARADWRGRFDALMFAIGIPVAGVTGIAWVGLVLADAASTGDWAALPWFLLASCVAGYLAIVAVSLLVLRLEHATWPRVWQTVAGFPIYLLSWSVLNIIVLFWRDPTWSAIPHTEALSLDEVARPVDRDQRAAPAPAPVPLETEA